MWEYKTETLDYFDYQDEEKRLEFLNKQGQDGWECIKMEEQDEIKYTFWLKRMV